MVQNPYSTLKPNVVGSQKNRLSETILLSTHNIGCGLSNKRNIVGGNTSLLPLI